MSMPYSCSRYFTPALICYQHQLYPKLGPLGKKFLTSKSYFWLSGFATSLSLLIEEKVRHSSFPPPSRPLSCPLV
jgi:hypothetical protein